MKRLSVSLSDHLEILNWAKEEVSASMPVAIMPDQKAIARAYLDLLNSLTLIEAKLFNLQNKIENQANDD